MSEEVVPESGDAFAIGPLDMFLLISFVGFLLYWFLGKKKENSKPEITGLAGLQRSTLPVAASTDLSGFISKMKKGGWFT